MSTTKWSRFYWENIKIDHEDEKSNNSLNFRCPMKVKNVGEELGESYSNNK